MTSAAESITDSLRRTRQLMVQVSGYYCFLFCFEWDAQLIYFFESLCPYRRWKEVLAHLWLSVGRLIPTSYVKLLLFNYNRTALDMIHLLLLLYWIWSFFHHNFLYFTNSVWILFLILKESKYYGIIFIWLHDLVKNVKITLTHWSVRKTNLPMDAIHLNLQWNVYSLSQGDGAGSLWYLVNSSFSLLNHISKWIT